VKTQSTGIVGFQRKPKNPISLGSLQLSIKLKMKKKTHIQISNRLNALLILSHDILIYRW
jgi:hypothetical protein